MDVMTWVQTWAILVPLFGLGFSGFFFGNRRLDDLRADMNARFAIADTRLDDLRADMNARFATVDARFGSVETRLTRLEDRLASLDAGVHQEFRDLRSLLHDALRTRAT